MAEDKLALLRAKVEAGRARVAAPEFVAAEKERQEREALAEELREIERRERDALIARMLDDAAAKLGEDIPIEAVAIEAKPHVFIVSGAGPIKHKAWEKGQREAREGKMMRGTRTKVDADEVTHAYVVAGVVAWNADGKDVPLGEDDTDGWAALHALLRENTSFETQLFEPIARLDGAAADTRKR